MGNKSVKTRRENGKRVVEYYDEGGNKTKTHVDGEAAWRNNNPGNIKWDGKRDPEFFKDKLGAIGSDGTFAVFPEREDGLGAKTKLMKVDRKYKGTTISEAMHLYAPPNENNTKAYLEFIKQKTGIDTSKKVDELSAEEYDKFMGAIREYESSGPEKGKGTLIDHSNDKAAPPAPGGTSPKKNPQAGALEDGADDNDTLVAGAGNGTLLGGAGSDTVTADSAPAEPASAPEPEQKQSEGPADPQVAAMVEMAGKPVDNPGRAALLKPVENLTQPEMMDMINHAQGDYRGHRSGDPLKYHTYEKVQDWHAAMYGDGPQQYDGGKPIEQTPIRPIPEQPSPHTTPNGEDLWQATARIGSKVADAAGSDGYANAVTGLQRGLNMLNASNPLPKRSPAYGPYTGLGPVDEDGKYGPQTDFALKHATARLGPAKVEDGLALGRFNTFARNAQKNGNPDGLEDKTHSIFGPLFRGSGDDKTPKVEGGVLQETLNDLGSRKRDDWEPLKVDNWIGPKTTQAFGSVLQDEDADGLTRSFGRGLGLL
ncbi:hypothetical protein [Magnetospirillum moscoviense]|uniref:Uncharacterized protein n=1 Tax=Magnetospirillum moscoviense TaxID=1437059 RepID=A0A178MJM9_9PROT|nr:hypothetical protein [Magnetospirillum moscoviense]OAN48941.1 hypothetical protein A6A05_02860 [Magnetospirillum moscoviense]